MGNVLEFLLRLKDMLTPGMLNAARVSSSTATQITNNLNRASPRMLNNSIDELRRKLEAVNRTRFTTRLESEFIRATQQARDLERQIARLDNYGKKDGGFMAGIGAQIASYVSAATLAAFISSSVGAAMDFSVKNITYEVLTQSKVKGQALAGQLLNLKQNTIMGTSVYGNAQTLMGFGVDQNEVIRDLKMIGDIAMGDVDRMQRLTLVFAQTAAAGKLMGQDLLQYVNAGFNPLAVMAEHWKEFGLKQKVNVGQLRDMMSEGKISSEAVKRAFEIATSAGGRYHGMMDRIATTTAGKLQLMKGHYAAFQIHVGQSLERVTAGLLDTASAVLKTMTHTKTAGEQAMATINQIRTLQLELTSSNTAQSRRLEILKQLEDLNPNIVKGINAEAIEYGKLADNINSVIAALHAKRVASSIEEKNAKTVTRYTNAQASYSTTVAGIMALIAETNPDLAARTDMTFGQKQIEAQRILKERIEKNRVTSLTYGSGGSGTVPVSTQVVTTEEQANLERLQRLISATTSAAGTVNELSPTIQKLQKNIKIATDAYNKFFDLTPPIGAKKTEGSGTGTGGDLIGGGKADKINAGGQRSIVINIGKQIEHLDIHVMGKEEVGREIEPIVREAMVRLLHSINGENDG